jgi:formylmethanofuran dehydrogenase subunit E
VSNVGKPKDSACERCGKPAYYNMRFRDDAGQMICAKCYASDARSERRAVLAGTYPKEK